MRTRHEVADEIRKVQHIFKELDREYDFMISKKSKLPVLVIAPHGSVGLFLPCLTWNKEVERVYMQQMQGSHLQTSDIPLAELVAHTLRCSAAHKANAKRRDEFFDRAFALYRTILFHCPHTSLIAMLNEETAMSTKIRIFTPVPDLHKMSTSIRRLISHCLGGMALCALMGKRNPFLFFGLASMAINWEPFHPLELVNFLRMNLLVTGLFHLEIFAINDNSLSTMDAETAARIIDSPLVSIPVVYRDMNRKLVLPMVLKHGSETMLAKEKELIPAEDWDKV
jgi:hypothetical protein